MSQHWLLMLASFVSVAISSCEATARSRNMEEERVIGACIRKASLGHPWLEKTLWGLRDQEAGWLGAEVRNSNGSHDLGPFQINSWWVPRIAARIGHSEVQVRRWLRSDACFNAEAARWVFLSAINSTGDYWKAIGVYHSPTLWRQLQYSASVATHLRARFGGNIFR
jgi:hypothetical protein